MMTAICLGAFISHFTAGIVNVSLPHMTKVFETSLESMQWLTTGYLLVIVSLLPVMGKLGDRYGHRSVHNAGFALFAVSSVLIAFSPNMLVLLIFRMVQAVGAAMFQATNIALIALHMPKENRGRALGIVSTAVALGGMTGPVAGGFIAERLSWHWLFWIHVPIAFLATGLAWRYVPAHGQQRKSVPLDAAGMVLFAAVIGSVLFGLSNAAAWGWLSVEMIVLFVAAFTAFRLLLLRESRQAAPFLPLKVFRIPAVSFGLIISCASFAVANAVLVAMPFYLSGVADISPITAGKIMIAYPAALALSGPFAGHLSDRYGSRAFMFAGFVCMGAGLSVFSFFPDSLPIVIIIGILAIIGMGMGLIAAPNNSYMMQKAPIEHAGSIGGMIALTRNAGMALGAALGLGVMIVPG
ncbi:MFS transporter [Cohnella faecalis]